MFNFRRYCEARLQIAGAAIDTEFIAWLRVLVRKIDPTEDSAVIAGKIEEIIDLVDAYKAVKGVV